MTIYAGILAGGSGTRMTNSSIPKQFIKLNGIPIVIITLRKFLKIREIEKIIIAINKNWFDYCENLLLEFNLDKNKIIIVEGGTSRFESLSNIVKTVAKYNTDSIIISHDCARPFVSEKIINENIIQLKNYDAVTTAMPTTDTIIVSKNNKESLLVPNRNELFLDQGPQTFYTKDFLNLIKKVTKEDLEKYIEIGKLYLDNNLKVGIVRGDKHNFKITTKQDLKYAEFLILEGEVK